MKLAHILSTSVLAVVVLSNTGCSVIQKEEAAPSESAQISANKYSEQHGNPIPEYQIKSTETPAPVALPKPPVVPKIVDPEENTDAEEELSAEKQEAADAVEAGKITSTLNDFYVFALNPASYEEVKNAGTRFSGRDEVSEEEVAKFAEDYSTLFRHFDTSSAENIQNAYLQIAVSSAIGKAVPGMAITIPVEAVTVYGDSATIENSMATVSRDGKDYTSQYSEVATGTIDMVKLPSGAWVIQAAPAEQ